MAERVRRSIVCYFARLRRDGPRIALTILPAYLVAVAWVFLHG